MLKRFLILLSISSVILFAAKIELNLVEQNPERKAINGTNEILSFNSSVKDAMKSVVNISTKKRVSHRDNPMYQMFDDPFFKQFFGHNFRNAIPKERVEKSLGSGVILSKDGYIVTNAHVVDGADEIVVAIGGEEKEYSAKIIGTDKDSDLAVIKIKGNNFEAIKVGGSKNLLIGDVVFAIGNPFGVGQTTTQGIISALNKNKVGINRYENFIQTDASINPGNSGGALIDSRGALIGINSAILTRSGGNHGVGFAIPVDMVKSVVKKLVSHGKVQRGYLGVSIEDLDKDTKKIYNHKEGALVLDVGEDTPAEKYGIKRGDLIYSINGKDVKSANELSRMIASYSPNDKIKFYIERDNKNITIKAKLASRDSLAITDVKKPVLNGMFVSDITQENARRFRLSENTKGVLITEIEAKSEAEDVGFMPGDVIIQIENKEIESVKDLQKALKKYKKGTKRIYINRYGRVLMSVIG